MTFWQFYQWFGLCVIINSCLFLLMDIGMKAHARNRAERALRALRRSKARGD